MCSEYAYPGDKLRCYQARNDVQLRPIVWGVDDRIGMLIVTMYSASTPAWHLGKAAWNQLRLRLEGCSSCCAFLCDILDSCGLLNARRERYHVQKDRVIRRF